MSFLPPGVPRAHLLNRYRCPQCGDAASVFQSEAEDRPRFVCAKGHRGVWVANAKSDHEPPPLPTREQVEQWAKWDKERNR